MFISDPGYDFASIPDPGVKKAADPDWVSLFRFRHSFFSFRYRNDQMPDVRAFRHKKNCRKVEKGTLCTFTQLAVSRHTPRKFILLVYRTSGVIFFIDYCTAIRDT